MVTFIFKEDKQNVPVEVTDVNTIATIFATRELTQAINKLLAFSRAK